MFIARFWRGQVEDSVPVEIESIGIRFAGVTGMALPGFTLKTHPWMVSCVASVSPKISGRVVCGANCASSKTSGSHFPGNSLSH